MLETAAHLLAIIARLRRAVAGHMAKQAQGPLVVWLGTRVFISQPPPNQPPPLPAATWALLITRLGRLAERLDALFTRWQAGTLPKPRPATPRLRTSSPARAYPRLPTSPGWINARVANSPGCAGDLHFLLQGANLRQFVADAPQAGRLLRPLCRALCLSPPDWLALPPRARAPRPKPAPPPAPPEPGTPDRPLPDYVLAAVRAWREKPA